MAGGMTVTDTLTVAGRRRALCALSDDYSAEINSNDRPITAALPLILPPLCAAHLDAHMVLTLFHEFAQARAVSGRADVSYDHMNEAEARAEMLLGQLVGEWFG